MSPPALIGGQGAGARAALAYLATRGLRRWTASRDVAAALACPSNAVSARLELAATKGWVQTQLAGPRRRQWRITRPGLAVLEVALAVVDAPARAATVQAARRAIRQAGHAPAPGSVAAQLLAALEAAPAGAWLRTAELLQAAGLPDRLSIARYFRGALAKGLIEKSFVSDRRVCWRLVRDDVADLEVDAVDLVHDSADERAERARQVARHASWRPLAGSVAARAIAQMGCQPRGARIEPAPLADWIGSDAASVVEALAPAVLAGLVERLPSPRDVRRPVFRLTSWPAAEVVS